MASAESGSLLRGDPVGFCNEPFVELDATARAKAGAVFEHAGGGDPADVRDSELQRRNASPVDCRSAVNAQLGFASAVREVATARIAAI